MTAIGWIILFSVFYTTGFASVWCFITTISTLYKPLFMMQYKVTCCIIWFLLPLYILFCLPRFFLYWFSCYLMQLGSVITLIPVALAFLVFLKLSWWSILIWFVANLVLSFFVPREWVRIMQSSGTVMPLCYNPYRDEINIK